MTREEWSLIVQTIRNTYPPHLMKGMFETEQSIRLWYEMLKDLEYKDLGVSLQKYISQNQYPPTIADLRGGCASIQNGEYKPWEDGWQEVCEAIRKYGYMREGEALHSLSPMARKIVLRLDYQALCASENPMADRANFRDIYNNMVNKQKQREQLSPNVRNLLDKATERRYAIPEKEHKFIQDKEQAVAVGESVELSDRVQELLRKTREGLKGE